MTDTDMFNMLIALIILIMVIAIGLTEQTDVEYCDADFCYRNGYVINENDEYIEKK